MSSVIAICNLALSNLGKDSINSLNEPTAEARACRQFYDHTRDVLLQAYPWRFARKTQSLAEVENDKAGEWSHAYDRPTDCLKVISVGNTRQNILHGDTCTSAIPYDAVSDRIYCNVSPAYLNFTERVTDPTKFSPLFTEALAWHLTVRLAMPLTRDPKVRADAFQLAMETQEAAAMADANEVRHNYDHDSELVEVRG